MTGANPTTRTYDRVCDAPAAHDGGVYRCPKDSSLTPGLEQKTESCASVSATTPVCYAGGTCGCEKVSGAGTKERGDASSQGSCATGVQRCYADGLCKSEYAELFNYLSIFSQR